MHIDKWKRDDGYYDQEGLFWETAESFLQGSVLGFCCCGSPRENLELVRDALTFIKWQFDTAGTGRPWSEVEQREVKVFGSQRLAYFVYYWLAKTDFTEHGGAIPGWLTDKGERLLQDLDEFLALPVEDE